MTKSTKTYQQKIIEIELCCCLSRHMDQRTIMRACQKLKMHKPWPTLARNQHEAGGNREDSSMDDGGNVEL